jgi:hypothetical protein
MIRREAARPNGCREQPAIQSAHLSRSSRCPQRSLHKPRHRTSMPGSHARAPAGPRCRGSDGRHAPVDHKRELAGHEGDARGTPPQQIAIGMLNDVKCGDLLKIVWHDGIGMSLYAKRLERGRFIWPSPADGVVAISAAQLAYMLDGIDWRNPVFTWRPEVAG